VATDQAARSPHNLELRPIAELQAAWETPTGERREALREAAQVVRDRLSVGGALRGVRTIALVSIPSPARLLLGRTVGIAGAAASLGGSAASVTARMVIVRFHDFEGAERTLVWEPALAEAAAAAPVSVRLSRLGRLQAARAHGPRELCSIERALTRTTIGSDQVDLVAFGDLRGHDLRRVAGTTRPLIDEHQPRPPLFGEAPVLLQAAELAAAREPHPLQAMWYVPGATEDLIDRRVLELTGDVALGPAVALIRTPGLSPGHQSLVLGGAQGPWVVSSNGVASDCWQPLLSKIPGARRGAELDGSEVMLPTTGAQDDLVLYDSMVLERSLAGASPADPRWLAILPNPELSLARRQWPAVPTFSHGGLEIGAIATGSPDPGPGQSS
jgi:hypothetical protein